MLQRDSQRWSDWLMQVGALPGAPQYRDRCAQIMNAAALRAGDTVVDVGAGLGLLTFELARRVRPAGRVIAIEPAADCREQLVATARSLDLSSTVEVRDGLAEALPLEDHAWDLVVGRSVLLYVRDRRQALREFGRVLKPGGRLVCSEPINLYTFRTGRLHQWFDLTELGEAAKAVREVEQHYYGLDDPASNFTEQDLLEDAAQGGFTTLRLVLERFLELRYMSLASVKGLLGWDQPLTAVHPTLRQALSEHLSDDQIAALLDVVERQLRGKTFRVEGAVALLTGYAGSLDAS